MTDLHELADEMRMGKRGWYLEVDGPAAALDYARDGYREAVRQLAHQVELSKRPPGPWGIPIGQIQLRHYTDDAVIHGGDCRLTQAALRTALSMGKDPKLGVRLDGVGYQPGGYAWTNGGCNGRLCGKPAELLGRVDGE